MNYSAFACGVCALSTLAMGQIVFESESNDTIATANFVGSLGPPGGAIVVDGNIDAGDIGPGDVDWFEFNISQMSTLLFTAVGSTTIGADVQMMLVDGSGTDVIAFDDDSGPDLLPAMQVFGLAAGTYFVGISGFADISFPDNPVDDDLLFDGFDNTGVPHDQTFDYKLTISANLVPTPGAAAVLGLAGLAAVRRRR